MTPPTDGNLTWHNDSAISATSSGHKVMLTRQFNFQNFLSVVTIA